MLKNLKELRNSERVSQQQLADVIGVSQQSINKYENHSVEPDIDTMIKIADFFSVSVDYLIGRTEVKNIPENFTKYDLCDEEKSLVDGYRKANIREKEIVRFILKCR